MSQLFSPLVVRGVTFKNRVWVSPMCQYSAVGGVPNDWHFVHLGSRAVGGAGLVVAEATGVSPEGRISPGDAGLWNDEQQLAWSRVTTFIHAQGALAGVQLAHAGRKASTHAPWDRKGNAGVLAAEGGWVPVAPSALPFDDASLVPRALDDAGVAQVVDDFVKSAQRAVAAGFDVVEVHAAHGYLLHQFLSPISNQRADRFGGSFENRVRVVVDVVRAVRAAIPDGMPLLLRISATDWVEGGWDLPQSVQLAALVKDVVDVVDCSSGGSTPHAKIPVGPGYQVPFARAIRKEAGVATAAVGLITDAKQAEKIVVDGDADAVFLARAMLRDPYWATHAARELGVDAPGPKQYWRA